MAFVKLDLEILASDLSDSEKLLYSLIKSRWDISQLKDDDGKKIVFLTQTEMCNLLNWERQKTLRTFSSLKAKNLLSAKRTKNAKNAIFFDLDSIKNDSIKNDSIKNDSIKNDSIKNDTFKCIKNDTNNVSKMIPSSYIYNRENRIIEKNSFSAGENSQFASSENSQNVKSAGEKAVNNFLYGNSWNNRWLLPRDKPPFISDEVWADYCAFKRERGQKVVRTELKAFLAQLEKAHNLGVDVNARIIECISKGYASPVLEPRANETNAKSKKGTNTESVNAAFYEWLNKYHANEQDEIIDAYCENYIQQK